MNEIIERLARIEEKVTASHEKLIQLNGSVRTNCMDIAVLKEQNGEQKRLNYIITTGFIGGIISKIMGYW